MSVTNHCERCVHQRGISINSALEFAEQESVGSIDGDQLGLNPSTSADNAAISAVLDFYEVSARVRIERMEEVTAPEAEA